MTSGRKMELDEVREDEQQNQNNSQSAQTASVNAGQND